MNNIETAGTMKARSLMNRRGEFRNAVDDSGAVEILLYDEIGYDPWFDTGVSAKMLVDALDEADGKDVNLRINSPGGSVFEGIAMLNALRRYKGKVTVYVDALAASSASVVMMGADEVVMSRNAEVMIHDAWGLCVGNAADMAEMAQELSHASDNLASAYAEKAGGTPGQWRKAMQAETWYSDKEAVAAGLADRVDSGKTAADKAKAKFNLAVYNYAGRSEAPAPDLPAEPETPTQEGSAMTDTLNLRERLGLDAEATDDEVVAKLDAVIKNSEAPAEEGDTEEVEETVEEDTEETQAPGVVQVDEQTLNNLKRDAEAGRKAFDAQQAQHREDVVMAAVRDGRISLDRKAEWLNTLEKDPGAEKTLNSLAKGLVPVGPQKGYTGDLSDVGEDDEIYNKLFNEKVS